MKSDEQRHDPGYRFRTGRRNRRVLYLQMGSEPSDEDEMVGAMDTDHLATMVVSALNKEITG